MSGTSVLADDPEATDAATSDAQGPNAPGTDAQGTDAQGTDARETEPADEVTETAAADAEVPAEPAFDHELAEAVAGEAFAAMFDAEHFREGLAAAGVDAEGMDEAALRALLVERGEELRVSPTPFFDEAHYHERHPDIREVRAWGFRHFLVAGMDEGRQPHPLIDLAFIAADQGVTVPEAIRTWLTGESAPSETVWHGYRRWNDAPRLAQQRAIWRGLARHCPDHDLAERVLTYLPLLVEPRLAGDVGAWSLVVRALNEGAHDVLPSPFVWVPLARGPDHEGPPPLVESLPPDPPRRWSPTVRLDMAFYDVRNPDLAGWSREMALHFLRHGQFEGRIGHPMFDEAWYVARYGLPPGETVHAHYVVSAWRGYAVRSNAACMAPIDHAVIGGVDVDRAIDAIAAAFSGLFRISSSSAVPDGGAGLPPADAAIRGQIEAASRLDPAIRPDRPGRPVMPKPFDVGHAAPLHRMSRMLAGCDVVLMRDHVTIGGADRVAGAMARTLTRNGYRVGVLATARTPDHDRGAARYGDASIVVVEDLIGRGEAPMVIELAYEAATLPDVRAVMAVNSAAALEVFGRFGRQVAAWAPMFVNYFCDDLDEHGNPDGYPARTFLPLVGRIEAVFTDTVHLRDALRARVAPSVALAAKVRTLPTPYAPDHAPEGARLPSRRCPSPGAGRAWRGRDGSTGRSAPTCCRSSRRRCRTPRSTCGARPSSTAPPSTASLTTASPCTAPMRASPRSPPPRPMRSSTPPCGTARRPS